MEVFKGENRKDRKGKAAFDFSNDGKHLLLGLTKEGYLDAVFYYDDCEKDLCFTEEFVVDKSNYHIYKTFEDTFSSYGDLVFFDTFGADLCLAKQEDGYHFYFNRNFHEKNNMIEAEFLSRVAENFLMEKIFNDLQKYDPECHQIHMSEMEEFKTLKKN